MSYMGILHTEVSISALNSPDDRHTLDNVMVDTGSEYNWLPSDLLIDMGIVPVRVDRFETADGRIIDREVGFAMMYAAGRSSPTVVVFAHPGDKTLLGAIGLEGMNLCVDLTRWELVPAGPVVAAAA